MLNNVGIPLPSPAAVVSAVDGRQYTVRTTDLPASAVVPSVPAVGRTENDARSPAFVSGSSPLQAVLQSDAAITASTRATVFIVQLIAQSASFAAALRERLEAIAAYSDVKFKPSGAGRPAPSGALETLTALANGTALPPPPVPEYEFVTPVREIDGVELNLSVEALRAIGAVRPGELPRESFSFGGSEAVEEDFSFAVDEVDFDEVGQEETAPPADPVQKILDGLPIFA